MAGATVVTLSTVGSIKRTGAGITYAAVDGGMADNPRPAMSGARYQAFVDDHAAEPATPSLRHRRGALGVGRRADRGGRAAAASSRET